MKGVRPGAEGPTRDPCLLGMRAESTKTGDIMAERHRLMRSATSNVTDAWTLTRNDEDNLEKQAELSCNGKWTWMEPKAKDRS